MKNFTNIAALFLVAFIFGCAGTQKSAPPLSVATPQVVKAGFWELASFPGGKVQLKKIMQPRCDCPQHVTLSAKVDGHWEKIAVQQDAELGKKIFFSVPKGTTAAKMLVRNLKDGEMEESDLIFFR